MNAEIITIGDELLIGQVVDTNSAWLAQILNKNNIKIRRVTTISDQADEIVSALDECLSRSELVIITGGLGPTKDDITKKTLKEYFNTGWRTDQEVLEQLEFFFRHRGRQLLDINKLQAELPENCITLMNEWGTAPGMMFEKDGKLIISMPGVPFEMKNIFEHKALPAIVKRFKQPALIHKTIVTFNIPESMLAQKIADIEDELPPYIKLAYLPNLNIVRLRLSGTESEGIDINSEVMGYASRITERLGEAVVSDHDASLSEVVYELLNSYGKTLSIAESCTGGHISNLMTSISGASKVFVGSVVSYSNTVKHHQLGVESTLFETVGAVSEPVVTQMVQGVRERLQTDYAIAVSGVAGPGGGSEEKPVGTVVVGVCSAYETVVQRFHFIGDRLGVIGRSSNMAFAMLQRLMLKENQN